VLEELSYLVQLDIMAVLLSDASREECPLIGWQPLCAVLEALIPKILHKKCRDMVGKYPETTILAKRYIFFFFLLTIQIRHL
jgi:hypothetical protein